MNIYVYSDESGVFDKVHNDIYVFGGLVILDKEKKDEWSRRYSAAEKVISKNYSKDIELKASVIRNNEKNKLYRSLNNCYRFGVVINQNKISDSIYEHKKTKQRYLDYAYKIGVKKALEKLINESIINPSQITNIYFYIDEHTTATDGCYELREALEQELKFGTHNYEYMKYYPPILPELKDIHLKFYNSKSKLLIRAADIVANKLYYMANNNNFKQDDKLHITFLP